MTHRGVVLMGTVVTFSAAVLRVEDLEDQDAEIQYEAPSLQQLAPAASNYGGFASTNVDGLDVGSHTGDATFDALVNKAVEDAMAKKSRSPEVPDVSDFPFEAMEANQIVAAAKSEKKPAMILVTSDTCPTCHTMFKSMAGSATIKSKMSQFVSVHLGQGKTFTTGRGFNESYVPRIIFLSVDGHVLDFFSNRPDHPKFAYSFTVASDIERAMDTVLTIPADGGACNDPFQKVAANPCADTNDQCNQWAINGQCTLNFPAMKQVCQKACGLCSSI